MAEKEYVILDATLLSTLMSCPRYLDLRYNHKFVSARGKSNSLECGALVHKVLEVYYKHIIKGFKRTDAIGQGMIAGQMYVTGCPYCADDTVETPQCAHEPGEYPGLRNTPEANDGKYVGWRWALQTCEQYFEFYKNDAFIPLFAEQVKGDVLYEDEEIRVGWKAKFDLGVDTNQIGICPIDHKTMKQNRDKSSLNNQFIGQCILLKSRNIIINKIGFQTSLKQEERFKREVVSYSADRLIEWQSEILPYYAYKYLQYQENSHWPPNFTHCDNIFGSCQFKPICEADRNMRGEVLRAEFNVTRKWDVVNREMEE